MTSLVIKAFNSQDLPEHVFAMRAGPIRYEVHLHLANGYPLVIYGKSIIIIGVWRTAAITGCSSFSLDQTLTEILNLKKSYKYQGYTNKKWNIENCSTV